MDTSNQNIFGTRLKLARKMAGMSLQELSDKIGNKVSKQALNKYELGLMKPSNEVLLIVSQSLDVKPDFFLKKNVVELKDISFRKRASLSVRSEELIIEKARDYVERFFELENIMGIGSVFLNPLKNIIIKSCDDSESAAMKLRNSWELGHSPISNLIEMLELKGVKVLLLNDVDEIDGFSFISNNSTPVVIVNSKLRSIERVRFTIVHELAHLLLRFDKSALEDKKLIEKLCHRFASCFLIPTKKLIELIGGTHRSYIAIQELINIKEYFGISIRAIVYRLENLGVISNVYYKRWMIYMSKTYGQKNEPGKYLGVEKLSAFEQLINRALAESIISLSKAASLMNVNINDLRKTIISV